MSVVSRLAVRLRPSRPIASTRLLRAPQAELGVRRRVPGSRTAVAAHRAAHAVRSGRADDDVDLATGGARLVDDAGEPERLVVLVRDEDEHRAVRRRHRAGVALPVDLDDANRLVPGGVGGGDLDVVQPRPEVAVVELDVEVAEMREAVVRRADVERPLLDRSFSRYESEATPFGSSTLPRTLIHRCGTPTAPKVCGLPRQTAMLGPAAQGSVTNVRSPEAAGVAGRVGRVDAIVVGRRAGEARETCPVGGQGAGRGALAVGRRLAPLDRGRRQLVRRPSDDRGRPMRDGGDRRDRGRL